MTTHYASTTKHGAKLTIYYDTSDPQNPGWAWRVLGYDDNESGPLDDLDDLLAVVQGHAPDDLDGLPTFGGTEPDDTTEVWSWDENWLLVGTCASNLEIVDRAERRPAMMTPEQRAERLVASPAFGWMPGMRMTDGRQVVSAWVERDADTDRAGMWLSVVDADEHGHTSTLAGPAASTFDDALPDLTDPATVGCLLALLDEHVTGDIRFSGIKIAGSEQRAVRCWRPNDPCDVWGAGATLGEAIADALIALGSSEAGSLSGPNRPRVRGAEV